MGMFTEDMFKRAYMDIITQDIYEKLKEKLSDDQDKQIIEKFKRFRNSVKDSGNSTENIANKKMLRAVLEQG